MAEDLTPWASISNIPPKEEIELDIKIGISTHPI